MVNFGALPNKAQEPREPMQPGIYKAVVVDAVMRTPKAKDDGSVGKDYLNMKYDLYNFAGKKAGVMYDSHFDSTAQALQFKLGRLNYAAGLNLQGEVDLKDVCKLMKGREFLVYAKQQDNKPEYLEVDLFNSQCYDKVEQFAELVGEGEDNPFVDSTDDGDTGTY